MIVKQARYNLLYKIAKNSALATVEPKGTVFTDSISLGSPVPPYESYFIYPSDQNTEKIARSTLARRGHGVGRNMAIAGTLGATVGAIGNGLRNYLTYKDDPAYQKEHLLRNKVLTGVAQGGLIGGGVGTAIGYGDWRLRNRPKTGVLNDSIRLKGSTSPTYNLRNNTALATTEDANSASANSVITTPDWKHISAVKRDELRSLCFSNKRMSTVY